MIGATTDSRMIMMPQGGGGGRGRQRKVLYKASIKKASQGEPKAVGLRIHTGIWEAPGGHPYLFFVSAK